MKIQLTETAKQELEVLNARLSESDDPEYHLLEKRERLLCDAQLYIDEAYVDNTFIDLDVWCEATGEGEFQKDYRRKVKTNIGEMLIEDIITIIE